MKRFGLVGIEKGMRMKGKRTCEDEDEERD